MDIDIVNGIQQVARQLDEFAGNVAHQKSQAEKAAAVLLLGSLKEEVGGAGSGKVYKRGKRRTHRASRMGDPPAKDFGQLQRSATMGVVENGMRVGFTSRTAPMLERGTRHMGRRPIMKRALDRVKDQMDQAVAVATRGGLP
jgi:hypothetical protein